jgi:copper chaperone CopZ
MQIYKIDGMHCQACVTKIKSALEPLTAELEVSLRPPQAKFIPKEQVSLAMLNSALTAVGDYRLTPIAENQAPVKSIQRPLRQYYPLILIFLYILGVSFLSQYPMNTFMAGFFLVFSGFKLLDLPGFATAYATYDLLAKRWRGYGFVYPFLELALGIAYLLHWQPSLTYVFTIIIMGFSSFGVIEALTKKQKIQCACLGTVLNLPMTVVTLVEDLLMVMMAVILLAILTQ